MKNKPDYWYKQSSVIPYRIINNKIEVLIISSRKKKKWIFPKGIVELDLSARESAIKEAFEEAGISGKLSPNRLGRYSYKKWGGKCKVKVYALKINKILDAWEESFRDRKWIEINNTSEYIKDKKILAIVNKLKFQLQNENIS